MSSQPVIVTRGRPAASDRRATSPELTEQAFGPTNKSTTVRQSHIADPTSVLAGRRIKWQKSLRIMDVC